MEKKNALIVVDLQLDFVPGGSLPVAEGLKVVPLVDQLVDMPFNIKIATKDWHPAKHGSFASTHQKKPGEVIELAGIKQILWPDHCIQGTKGAEFVPGWDASKIERIFYKGTDENYDSYSAFFDSGHHRTTGLEIYLKDHGVSDLYIVGLATDYCVKYSVLDACRLGFNTYVIKEACRGVNLSPDDSEIAFEDMIDAGAHVVTMQEAVRRMKAIHGK